MKKIKLKISNAHISRFWFAKKQVVHSIQIRLSMQALPTEEEHTSSSLLFENSKARIGLPPTVNTQTSRGRLLSIEKT